MSSVISEGIILVAVVLAATLLSATLMNSIADIQSSTITSTKEIGETIKTSIKIIHAVNVSDTNVKIWIKNTGSTTIHGNQVELSDLYFGKVGNFDIYQYEDSGIGWNYSVLTDLTTKWPPQYTIEVVLTINESLTEGNYFVSFSTHNGVKDEINFSIGG